MDEQNRFHALLSILNHYGIQPHFVENFGNVSKVYAQNGVYALKKIPSQSGTDFIKQVRLLFQKGYHRIVPIYPTLDGLYGVLYHDAFYYLMPWIHEERSENQTRSNEQLFRELARLHTLSVEKLSINQEDCEAHYRRTISIWENDANFLKEFIEHCESKWYMSPFELLFCLYYDETNQALLFAKNRFSDWYQLIKEQTSVRTVIIHGKLARDHFLQDKHGYGYFIGFENTQRTLPVHDLLPFLARISTSFPSKNNDILDWLYRYFHYFPLNEEEMQLLLSYLSYPSKFVQIAKKYYFGQSKKNELKFVQQLQREYWYLKNVEYIVLKIVEIERQRKEAHEKAQQES